MRKVAFFGSREWPLNHEDEIKDWLAAERLKGLYIAVVTDVRGAPRMAELEARLTLKIPIIQFGVLPKGRERFYAVEKRMKPGDELPSVIVSDIDFANWESAMYYRSLLAVERADFIHLFWDGHSRGTAHEIDMCKAANKDFRVHELVRQH